MPNHARRSLLQHVSVSGLSLLLSACSRTDAPQSTPPSAPAAHPLFAPGALRLDVRHRFTSSAETFTLERLSFEPTWPARLTQLPGGPEWGEYRLSLYDAAGVALVFRQGFETGLAPDARAATTVFSVRVPLPQRPLPTTHPANRSTKFQPTWAEAPETQEPPAAASDEPGQRATPAQSRPARVDQTTRQVGWASGKSPTPGQHHPLFRRC